MSSVDLSKLGATSTPANPSGSVDLSKLSSTPIIKKPTIDEAVEKISPGILSKVGSFLKKTVVNPLNSAETGLENLLGTKKAAPIVDNSSAGIAANTITGIPKSFWNFLGPGKIQDYLNTPEGQDAALNLGWKDVAKNIVPAATEFAATPVADVAGIFTGPKTFTVPSIFGNTTITNIQKQTADAIQNGENPYMAVVSAVPQSIFDGLMVAGVMEKVFSPRESVVATGVKTNDLSEPGNIPGDKSFRISQPPTIKTQPLPPEVIPRLEAQGAKFSPKYDPNLPTFFRTTSMGNGIIKGEVVQIKPSYFDVFKSKFGGDISKVPPEGTNTVYEKSTTLDEVHNNIEGGSREVKTPTRQDIQSVADEMKNSSPPSFKKDIQSVAAQFNVKVPEIEGIDLKQATRLSAEEAAPLAIKAADKYWNYSIQPVLNEGKGIVIGGDQLKDFFGKDYNDNNHPIYSQAANKLYERALKENPNDMVIFTGGGAASGKTELIIKSILNKGFNGIIYDSNLSNYEGAVKQIEMARAAGKNVEIHGVISNLDKSRTFSIIRENETGRGISDKTFARGHFGFPDVVEKLLKNNIINPDEVKIFDTRETNTFEEALEMVYKQEYMKDPLATLQELGYTENNLKKDYAKEKYNSTTGQRQDSLSASNGSSETSRQNRANKENANRQRDEELLGKTEKEINDLPTGTISLREGGKATKNLEGRSGEGMGSRIRGDVIQAAERLSGYTRETGESNQLVARQGKDLAQGKSVVINQTTFDILREAGYSDVLVENLKSAQEKGGVKNIILTEKLQNKDFVSAFSGDTIYLNPTEIDNEIYADGNIINHELAGHSWYLKLSNENRVSFYTGLKNNVDTIKEAWEDSDNPYKNYWERTLNSISNQVLERTTPDVTKRITQDFGLTPNPDITLDQFIDQSLNIDKLITAINAELARIGRSPITLEAHNTVAVQEHVAMIAEKSNTIAPNEDVIGNYVEDVKNGNLKYGTNATNSLAYQGETDLSITTLQKLKGRSTVSKQYILDLANSGDLKQVERDLIREVLAGYPDGEKVSIEQFAKDVKIELLPLKIQTVGNAHENVVLSDDIRGNVADYETRIYESPIKTSAGDIHFSQVGGSSSENYFGHTRIEDMVPSKADDLEPLAKEARKYKSAEEFVKAIEYHGLYNSKDYESILKNGFRDANEGVYVATKDEALDYGEVIPTLVRKEAKNLEVSKDGKVPIAGMSFDAKDVIPIPRELDTPQALTDFYNKAVKEEDRTRRVIEVQSDLYQKGKLENETTYSDRNYMDWVEEKTGKLPGDLPFQEEEKMHQEYRKSLIGKGKRGKEIQKLQQYNDPTAHFRMVREEVKKAAQDGKTKLQFPTGETAMKIEGLGDSTIWSADNSTNITPQELKVGLEIYRGSEGVGTDENDIWIITDVLGDGKFKAVQKSIYDNIGSATYDAPISLEQRRINLSETFDISGKVDTNNPIYKFYEKDLGRYLRNKYGASLVTDDKGVTWNEVKIDPDMATAPVIAFRQKTQDIDQLKKMLEREQESLAVAEANPEMHANVYGPERMQKYKDRITELKDRIAKAKNPTFNTGNKLDDLRKTLEHVEKRVGVPNAPIDFKGNTLRDLEEQQVTLEAMKDSLDNNPLKNLEKYEAQSGIFAGELPEVTGKSLKEIKESKLVGNYRSPNVIKFMQEGDQLLTDAGYENTEEGRAAYQQYKDMKANYKSILRNFTGDVRAYQDFIKQDEKSLEETGTQLPVTLDDIEPPIVRGEIQAPKLDFRKWRDKARFLLERDTFERNLEKVATKEDADKLKKFIVEPVRENELARIKFTNDLKEKFSKKLKELGIKRNTIEDELIQKFGEKQISLDELKVAAPKKWQEIQTASNYFRNVYDNLLDAWNDERKKFGYPIIPKVPNYFRHFDEINFFVKNYGVLRSQDELPTEIAGKTEFFKPGKPFTTAEMHRTGNSTKYSAIGGFNNYIDSVSKQIFHIDSIQRGRALEKYMEASAKLARSIGEPLLLSNFIANLREYVNNGLAGKTATLDRALEILGRRTLNSFQTISKLIGKNIIVGNISTALSHLVSLPLIAATTDKIPLMKGGMTTLTSPLKSEPFSMIDGQESSYLVRRFPIEEIMPTMPKTAEKALSYFFTVTDKFKSRLAVSSKYYEGLKNGLSPSEAMKQADIYAGKIIGDYSIGQKPNLMNTKTTSLIAQFQLGLNDSISVLLHDIPEGATYETKNEKGETVRRKKKWQIASKLIQFAIFSYLFNELFLKKIRGSGKGIDPIDLGLTLTGLNDEGNGQSIGNRLKLAGTDLAGELPFTSAVTGNFPLSTALSQPVKDLLAGNYTKFAEGIAANFASPIGGGLQAKKTIEGYQAIKRGETDGKAEDARALFFGASTSVTPLSSVHANLEKNLKTANTKLSEFDSDLVKKAQDIYDAAEKAGLNTVEADQIVSDAYPDTTEGNTGYTVYKSLLDVEKNKDAIDLESKILPIVQKANEIGFNTAEADKLISDSFPDTPEGDKEFDVYKSIKNSLYGVNNQKNTSLGTWDKQSLVTHIANIAKSIGTDPVTAFNDIFAGNSSWRLLGTKNGQVIVQRMSEADSEAIKKNQGGDTKEFKLDHGVAIAAGGNNGDDNLQLIPTGDENTPGTWAWNTRTEDFISKSLGEGKITGKKAREYMIRFKATAGEPLSPTLQKEFKDKYNSSPITPDQIKQEIDGQ